VLCFPFLSFVRVGPASSQRLFVSIGQLDDAQRGSLFFPDLRSLLK
jgi:hypothetical protein